MTHTVDVDLDRTAEVFAGEDKVIVWTVLDKLDAIVNVTGWTFGWQARLTRYTTGSPILIKATGGAGITVPTGTDGKVNVAFASADTASLKAGTYYYGLARTNGGAWDVVAEGEFVLRKAAIHAT